MATTKITFEVDLGDLNTYDAEGENLLSALHERLVCASLERLMDVMSREKTTDKVIYDAIVHQAKQEVEAMKRLWASRKIEVSK